MKLSTKINPSIWSDIQWVKLVPVKWVYHPEITTFFADFGGRTFNRTLLKNKELVKWCKENKCKIYEGWVECPDEETATMFKLTWI